MTLTDELIDPMANPAAANAAVASILEEATAAREPIPTIDPPADDVVRLPGGLIQEEFGSAPTLLAQEVQVRELTGADEEVIAKARLNGNIARFQQALLRCGVVKIGKEAPTQEMLKDMLVGDQDAIILGIRRATYGDEIEFSNFICPGCSERFELKLTLDDIKIRSLQDPLADQEFTVPLRKGGHARVRFPNGHDMEAALDSANVTEPQRNTVFLSRCIRTITSASGDTTVIAGNKDRVSHLGLVDRRNILNAIKDKQPGPKYDDVKFTHSCGREVEVFLNLGDLFRDL